MYICIYVYICIYIYVCMCVYIYIHTYIHTHIDIPGRPMRVRTILSYKSMRPWATSVCGLATSVWGLELLVYLGGPFLWGHACTPEWSMGSRHSSAPICCVCVRVCVYIYMSRGSRRSWAPIYEGAIKAPSKKKGGDGWQALLEKKKTAHIIIAMKTDLGRILNSEKAELRTSKYSSARPSIPGGA